MPRYTHITEEEFHKFMQDNKFVCTVDEPERERIYEFSWHDDTYTIKVYSSIIPGTGSRKRGADAIRVVMFMRTDKGIRPVWKAARVYRTKNWRISLLNKIHEALFRGRGGQDYKCKFCKSPMVYRVSKHGEFWGCSSWPTTKCSYTETCKR